MFHLFSRAEAWIRAFEREQTGRKQRKENFGSLYRLLSKELEGHFAGLYQSLQEMGTVSYTHLFRRGRHDYSITGSARVL